jgi:hypothetical protein
MPFGWCRIKSEAEKREQIGIGCGTVFYDAAAVGE